MADEQNPNQSSAKPRPGLPPIKSSVASGGGGAARPSGQAPRPAAPLKPATGEPSVVAAPAQEPAPVAGAPKVEPASVAQVQPPIRPALQEVRKVRQDKPPENDQGIWRISRKNFLSVAGWFAFFSFLGTATLGAIRLMVPRVLYEAPSAFKAGFPADYVVGEVNEKYKDEFRVWIVREPEGFYALSAICTHLGCTPRWLPPENKFKCPCHGSGYHKDGINFEGPTPRPLERLKITLADDGQILIDRNVKFLYEKQQWSKQDAFLKYV